MAPPQSGLVLRFVELLGNDSGLARALDRARAKVQTFGKQVASVGAGVTAGGVAILAPITGLFAAAVDRAAVLDNLARQLGTTVEEVSALGYAFEAAGLKQEEFLDVMKTLDQKLSQGLDGKDEAADAFRRLGLSMRDLSRASPTERLDAVGKALNGLALASDRTEFAMKLLGGQGGKTLRIFERGPGALKELTDQAAEVGAVMSGETAASAVKVARAFQEVYAAGTYALLAIGEALLPQAEAIREFARHVVIAAGSVRKWIGENQGLVLGAVAVGVALVVAGVTLTAFGLGIAALAIAVGGLATGLVALKGAVLAAFSPIALGLRTASSLTFAFVAWTQVGHDMAALLTGELSTAWTQFAAVALESWQGISSAMKRGDLATAGEIAMAGLEVAWLQGTLHLRKMWSGFTSYLGDVWSTTAAGLRLVFVDVTEAIGQLFARMIAGILGQAGNLASVLGKDALAGTLNDYAAEVRRGAELDARAAEMRRKAIVQDLLADVGARADAAGEALAGPRMALEEARRKLADLLKAEAARGPTGTPAIPAAGPAQQAASALARSVRGAFSAPNFAALLGAGDSVAQRQLKAQEDGNKKLDEIKAELKKRPPLFG